MRDRTRLKRSVIVATLAGALAANALVCLPIAARADDDKKDGKKIIIIVRPPTKTHDGK